jgi:hypothetical protein
VAQVGDYGLSVLHAAPLPTKRQRCCVAASLELNKIAGRTEQLRQKNLFASEQEPAFAGHQATLTRLCSLS